MASTGKIHLVNKQASFTGDDGIIYYTRFWCDKQGRMNDGNFITVEQFSKIGLKDDFYCRRCLVSYRG